MNVQQLKRIFCFDEDPEYVKSPRRKPRIRRKPCRLRWTTDKPAEPGFYFVQHPETKVARVVFLHEGEDNDIRPWLLRVGEAKEDTDTGLLLCDLKTAYLWAGPIPMPEGE